MISYFVPDFDRPSWGVGLIYHHVRLLRKNGVEAEVVHERAPFRLSWLDVDVPVRYLPDFRPRPRDVLVVPEVRAGDPGLRVPCRRMVFVQNSFLILRHLEPPWDYRALGFEHALVTQPHMRTIVERHHGVECTVVPPFVAPYFFVDREELHTGVRERRILLVVKEDYRKLGLPDLDLVAALLRREEGRTGRWSVVELAGMDHREAARLMRTSTFLVNVHCLEGFNATVAEGMAAGCIPVCYDAFGGRDYLRDGVNAFVFPNNHAYPLAEKLLSLMDGYENLGPTLDRVREGAYDTAHRFTDSATESALRHFHDARLS